MGQLPLGLLHDGVRAVVLQLLDKFVHQPVHIIRLSRFEDTGVLTHHIVAGGYFVCHRFGMEDEAQVGLLVGVVVEFPDQLAEAGVVGEEEGTKPRKILMSAEEFEEFMEQQA